MSLPLRYFEERKVGDIMKRFGENARIRDFLTGRALGVVLDTLMIFVYLALMFYYNAKLTLVALVFIPGYIALTAIFTPVFKRQFREAFEQSERAVQQNLDEILKGRTTFIIAHRLSTARNADLIIVMDRGAILETGTPYSLMEQRALYYYLNSRQSEG